MEIIDYDTWAKRMLCGHTQYSIDTLRAKLKDTVITIQWDYRNLSSLPSYGVYEEREYNHLFEIPYENILLLYRIKELTADPDYFSDGSWSWEVSGVWSE